MYLTTFSLIQCSYFFLFLFSIIVLFDILIRFKSPFKLKTFFILFVLSILVGSFNLFIRTEPDQYVLINMTCAMIVGTSMVQIFTNLYFIQHRKIANIYTIAAYTVYIFLIFYVEIVGYETVFPKSSMINSLGDQFAKSVNLPKYIDFFLELDFILFNLFCLYYIFNILFKFSYKNIYFKKIQVWTFCFFMVIFTQIIFIILSFIFKFPNEFNTYIRIVFVLALLLIILYRPSFINKNGSKISFGFLFKSDSFETKINEIDFDFHFYNNMYYKNQTANLLEFSNIMGVNKDSLLNHIYFKYSMGFDDLINKNRIEYFIEIMKQPENKNFTIDALGKEAGFSSRQNLYKPFKKFHGGNPSDLLYALGD